MVRLFKINFLLKAFNFIRYLLRFCIPNNKTEQKNLRFRWFFLPGRFKVRPYFGFPKVYDRQYAENGTDGNDDQVNGGMNNAQNAPQFCSV